MKIPRRWSVETGSLENNEDFKTPTSFKVGHAFVFGCSVDQQKSHAQA